MTSLLKAERELLSPPGDDIFEAIEHIKLSRADLAARLCKTVSQVNDLIIGKKEITLEDALKLEEILGIEAQFWLKREMNYRKKLAHIEMKEMLQEERKK